MSDDIWPFSDPKNVAVFTVSDIILGRSPILKVCHDENDGGWQFLAGGPLPDKKEWKLVALEEIVKRDPTIRDLAELPCGWHATRPAAGGNWVTAPQLNE